MSDSPAKKQHILVLEDDEAFAKLVTRMLEGAGFHVTTARDFVTALPTIEGSEHVDLLLADIHMPAGTPHGLSIGLMAQSKRSDIKIIYMSGSADPAVIARFAPQAQVLRKPFTATDLVATINEALAAPATRESAERH